MAECDTEFRFRPMWPGVHEIVLKMSEEFSVVMDMGLEENGFGLSEDGLTYVHDCERDVGYALPGDIADDMPER